MNSAMQGCRRRLALIAVIATLVAGLPRSSAGQLATTREYDIKAGFLFNFAMFVEWPEDAFKSSTDDLRLEIVGRDPFDGLLDRLVAGRVINKHHVVVVYSGDDVKSSSGQIVFFSPSMTRRVPELIAALDRAPALTVSDVGHFAEQGGMIGLIAEGGSVRFVINRTAAAKARLRMSSRLLSLARLVDSGPATASSFPPVFIAP